MLDSILKIDIHYLIQYASSHSVLQQSFAVGVTAIPIIGEEAEAYPPLPHVYLDPVLSLVF